MKVVAVYSTKGGVGKTSTAVNLAWQASQSFRVLLWDLDPQGAATFLLQVRPRVKGGVDSLLADKGKARGRVASAIRSTAYPGLDVLPADESYRDLELVLDRASKSGKRLAAFLENAADDYDVVVLDCPPGASLVAENAVYSADAVVVPLVPSPLALRSLEQVESVVADSSSSPAVIAFLSMVDRRKTAHREAVERLPAGDSAVIDVVVPATVTVERMGESRAPIQTFAAATEAARAYADLWESVRGRLALKPRKAGKKG